MAGKTRLLAALVALAVSGAACSSAGGEVDLSSVTVSTTATTATVTTAPTTTEATTTTLSERAIAEAEIELLISEWWTKAYDPDQGDPGGFEYLTGFMVTRTEEFNDEIAAQGFITVSRGGDLIEVNTIQVDLEAGQGTVTTCSGSDLVRLDAQTREPVDDGDDPNYQFTSEIYVALTADGWKISEWLPSYNTTPIECEVGAAK